jgi:hypothetical protein
VIDLSGSPGWIQSIQKVPVPQRFLASKSQIPSENTVISYDEQARISGVELFFFCIFLKAQRAGWALALMLLLTSATAFPALCPGESFLSVRTKAGIVLCAYAR